MNEADLQGLRRAKHLLENPGVAMKIANAAGKPVEWAIARLPDRAASLLSSATRAALDKALSVALSTLDKDPRDSPRNFSHRAAIWATGAAGGAFGLAGLPIELPVSTTIMLRSIADHARAQGEDLSSPQARMNCILVLALGGRPRSDDASEVGYFAARMAFARTVSEAAEYLAGKMAAEELADRSAPVLVRFITSIAARFGLAVEDKLIAQLVPVVGAAGGALVNDIFLTHFQDMGWGHFTIRRLERAYGIEEVREAYEGT